MVSSGSNAADPAGGAMVGQACAATHDGPGAGGSVPAWRGEVDRWIIDLYDELRRLACLHLAGFPRGVTLQPTVLVHQALVRLLSRPTGHIGWNDRNHFYHSASLVMRRELLSWVKKRRSHQAKAAVQPLIEATSIPALAVFGEDRIEALDAALRELERFHPRWARVVNCRWFLGMTIPQTAEALDMGERLVATDWRFAQAWLRQRVRRMLEA